MSSPSAPNRRSFLVRSAAIAAVPAVVSLAGGALAEPVLCQVREQPVGCVPAVPGRGGRLRLRASHQKYLGVLAAADVYTASTTFAILESVRLDLGVGSQVHP